MAKNPKYWEKRFEQILIGNEKLAIDFEKEMAKIYQELLNSTQAEIEAFYQRYSTSTGLDLAEVRKRLNPAQLKRFKTQQKIYLAKIKQLIDQGADLSKYEKTLRTLSGKAYVSRLQELQYNLNSQINILTGQQQVKMTGTLKKSYLQGYLQSTFALQKGIGFGYSFTVPNTDDVLKVLQTPWSGSNYSSNIWHNKEKLTTWLNINLPRHFAAGSGVPEMTRDLSKKLETNRKNAERLVRTETNYITNQSAMDAYKNSGVVDRYQILATLDSRTSDICRHMDGKVFNISERKVSINMPPFHARCRTTTVPYFNDDDLAETERAARDDKNGYYVIPANINYNEWAKKYAK